MSSRVLSTLGYAALEYKHRRRPLYPRAGYPVFVCHSAGSPDDGYGKALPALTRAVKLMGDGHGTPDRKGIESIGGTIGGALNWGNATSLARLDSMYTEMAKAKVHLLGVSMGTAVALRWAAANPAKVASINIALPMASLIHIYEQNQGSATITSAGVGSNTIATAWGLTYNVVTASFTSGSTAVTFTIGTMLVGQNGYLCIANTGGTRQTPSNPAPFGATLTFVDATHATLSAPATATVTKQIAIAQQLPSTADFAGAGIAGVLDTNNIPVRLFYSSVDLYVDPADVTALTAAIGSTGESHIIDTVNGHVNATIALWGSYGGGADFSELIAYLVSKGA